MAFFWEGKSKSAICSQKTSQSLTSLFVIERFAHSRSFWKSNESEYLMVDLQGDKKNSCWQKIIFIDPDPDILAKSYPDPVKIGPDPQHWWLVVTDAGNHGCNKYFFLLFFFWIFFLNFKSCNKSQTCCEKKIKTLLYVCTLYS